MLAPFLPVRRAARWWCRPVPKAGIRLAGEHAEVIFTAAQTLEEALAFRQDIDGAAAEFGRRPEEIAILPGLSTVIGSTEAEAQERRRQLAGLVPLPYAIGRSGQLGIDLNSVDLDAPVRREGLPEPEAAAGSQTFYRLVLGIIDRDRPTYRQLLHTLGGGAGHRIVVGTPEQIADNIERWYRAGSGGTASTLCRTPFPAASTSSWTTSSRNCSAAASSAPNTGGAPSARTLTCPSSRP